MRRGLSLREMRLQRLRLGPRVLLMLPLLPPPLLPVHEAG